MNMKLLKIIVRALILLGFILVIGTMGRLDMEDEIATADFYNELAAQTSCLP